MLTNAQLAAHFASLPADGPATILLLNIDEAVLSSEPLTMLSADDASIEWCGPDGLPAQAVRTAGCPHIRLDYGW